MIRRPPRSTQGVSSAASDVYKRQFQKKIITYWDDMKDKEVYGDEQALFRFFRLFLLIVFFLENEYMTTQLSLLIDFVFFVSSPGPHVLCVCLLYTSPSPRDLSTSRMPSSA
eukprot:TRINITY_DN15109_c0_g1_i1.p2 TRINITY_DN15109_c0_g1~~TRINITY_DN15109_c0_g1_i1.p2  ORF type:complete len:112 (+),score=15.79 TRINITY_DN15109_c0_g1_i1:97-432(+)